MPESNGTPARKFVTVEWDADGNAHYTSEGASPILLFGAAHVIMLQGEAMMGAIAMQQAQAATKQLEVARGLPGGLRKQ